MRWQGTARHDCTISIWSVTSAHERSTAGHKPEGRGAQLGKGRRDMQPASQNWEHLPQQALYRGHSASLSLLLTINLFSLKFKSAWHRMALGDLGILQHLPLGARAIFTLVQQTTACVKDLCLLRPSCRTCTQHGRDRDILWEIEDLIVNLICAQNSHGYRNALEYVKANRAAKLTPGSKHRKHHSAV